MLYAVQKTKNKQTKKNKNEEKKKKKKENKKKERRENKKNTKINSDILSPSNSIKDMERSYHPESSGSRPITEDKLGWARLVLR